MSYGIMLKTFCYVVGIFDVIKSLFLYSNLTNLSLFFIKPFHFFVTTGHIDIDTAQLPSYNKTTQYNVTVFTIIYNYLHTKSIPFVIEMYIKLKNLYSSSKMQKLEYIHRLYNCILAKVKTALEGGLNIQLQRVARRLHHRSNVVEPPSAHCDQLRVGQFRPIQSDINYQFTRTGQMEYFN